MNVRHEVERLFEIMRASVVMNSLTVKVVPKGRLVEASWRAQTTSLYIQSLSVLHAVPYEEN